MKGVYRSMFNDNTKIRYFQELRAYIRIQISLVNNKCGLTKKRQTSIFMISRVHERFNPYFRTQYSLFGQAPSSNPLIIFFEISEPRIFKRRRYDNSNQPTTVFAKQWQLQFPKFTNKSLVIYLWDIHRISTDYRLMILGFPMDSIGPPSSGASRLRNCAAIPDAIMS